MQHRPRRDSAPGTSNKATAKAAATDMDVDMTIPLKAMNQHARRSGARVLD